MSEGIAGNGLEKLLASASGDSEVRADAGNCPNTCAQHVTQLFLHPTTSSTIAPSVNTRRVKADVATMNLETKYSTISKFLRGTFSYVWIYLFPAAGGDVFSNNTVIPSAYRKRKIILARFS